MVSARWWSSRQRARGTKFFNGYAREIAAPDRPAVHHAQIALGRSGQEVVADGLPQEVVIAKTQEAIGAPGFNMREVKVVGAHAVADEIDPSPLSRFFQAFERAPRCERGFDVFGVVDEEHVEVVDAQNAELVFHIGEHALGCVVGIATAISPPLCRAVTADAPADDEFIAPDNALFDGEAEFAEGVPITPRTIEVVDADIHGKPNEVRGFGIGDGAKVVAKPLRAKRDHGDGEFGFAPATPGDLQIGHG